MGPEKNAELFKHYESHIEGIVEEREATAAAGEILASLSRELDEFPVKSVVTDPMLPAKLYALSHITNDPIGISGLSPMEYISFERSEMKVEAHSAPYHDIFNNGGGTSIRTRVIRIVPSETDRYGDSSGKEADLEFFGLNVYTDYEEDQEDIEVLDSSDDLPEAEQTELPSGTSPYPLVWKDAPEKLARKQRETSAPASLIVTHRRPIGGLVNVFAVRHKETGVVKIYSTDVEIDHVGGGGMGMRVERDSLKEISFSVQNKMKVTVRQLQHVEFEQAVQEFKTAREALGVAKAFDSDKHQLSAQERFAMRAAFRGLAEDQE